MGRPIHALILAALLFTVRCAIAAETPIPAPPTRWVTDTVGALNAQTLQALDARLAGYEKSTGHQVIVWIGASTGDASIEEWAVKAFEKWGIGRKGQDDGLAIFLMMTDRKVRIEVGYGLEGQVPDAIASRVIRDVITPKLKAGDVDGAVSGAVAALLAAIDGSGAVGGQAVADTTGDAAHDDHSSTPMIAFFVVFFFLFVGLLIVMAFMSAASLRSGRGTQRTRTRSSWHDNDFFGGGGFGGGGFSGGGFSGGGGSSGGGGASGSW